MDAEAMKMLAAGISMGFGFGPGIGIGMGYGAVQAVARNLKPRGQIFTNMIFAIALAEAVAIYALVVSIILLFVV